MKKNLIFLSVITAVLIAGCNMNKKNNSDVIPTGTDSSMMTKDSSRSGVTTLAGDTTAATINAMSKSDTTSKKSAVKADTTAKKLKKGKVSIVEATPVKNNGDMSADKEGFYTNTEVLPAFPGGQKALENFFEKNLQYPQEATDNSVEGTVVLNFAVDERGKVYAPKVTSKNIGYGIEPEALRVFSKMPAWTPGKIKGKNVKTHYTLPVKFQLD